MRKARVSLASAEIEKLNGICDSIIDIAKKTKIKVRGPIPLPTKILKLTTRKSPCGDGKASWEKYEMRIHKRLIDLAVDERALRLVMRVHIPEGVQIEIDLLE
jgi:small subunit ribosomal protein S10